MFYILLSVAFADTILLIDSEVPEYQVERALQTLNSDSSSVDLIPWSQIKDNTPPLQINNNAKLKNCSLEKVNPKQVDDQLLLIEQSFFYMELNSLQIHKDKMINMLICVDEIIDPSILARANFLIGVSNEVLGNIDDAKIAYQQALAIQQDLTWDEEFDPELKSTFEMVRYQQQFSAKSTVYRNISTIVPVYWNGRLMEDYLQVDQGLHYVQIQANDNIYTFKINIEQNETYNLHSVLDLPDMVSIDTAPEIHQRTIDELRHQFPTDDIYFISNGTVWKAQQNDWHPQDTVSRNRIGLATSVSLTILGLASHYYSFTQYQQFNAKDTSFAELEPLQTNANVSFLSAIGLYSLAGYIAWESK